MEQSQLKRLQIISFFAVAAFLALGCSIMARGVAYFAQGNFRANGPDAKQSRSVPSFNKVEAGGVFEVDISIGAHNSLTFEAPRDLLPHLTSHVQNGALSLGIDTRFSTSHGQKIKAHIVVSHLKAASI